MTDIIMHVCRYVQQLKVYSISVLLFVQAVQKHKLDNEHNVDIETKQCHH